VVVTIVDCSCPTDCTACCDAYIALVSSVDDPWLMDGSYTFDRVAYNGGPYTGCDKWYAFGTAPYYLYCHLGEWFVSFYAGGATCIPVFRSPVMGMLGTTQVPSPCPPEGEYTLFSDGGCVLATGQSGSQYSVTISGCGSTGGGVGP
jgi:hypothetical protein